MAKLTKDELIKQVEEMSVLELSDLVKALEEKFGVSASQMAAPAQAASARRKNRPYLMLALLIQKHKKLQLSKL